MSRFPSTGDKKGRPEGRPQITSLSRRGQTASKSSTSFSLVGRCLTGENVARLGLPGLQRVIDIHLGGTLDHLAATGGAHTAMA